MSDALEATLARCSGYATRDEYVLECGDDAYAAAIEAGIKSSTGDVRTALLALRDERREFNRWLFADPCTRADQRDLVLEPVHPQEWRVLGALNGYAEAEMGAATVLREIAACREAYARSMAAGIPSLADVDRLDAILGFGNPPLCPVCEAQPVLPGEAICGGADCKAAVAEVEDEEARMREAARGLREPVIGKVGPGRKPKP